MSFIVFLRKAKCFHPAIAKTCLQYLWESDKTGAMILAPLYQFNFIHKSKLTFMRCLLKVIQLAKIRTKIRTEVP